MKQTILNLVFDLSCIIVVCVFTATNVYSEPIKIICNTDNPKGSLHVVALEKFGELVKKYSGGRLSAQIHYRGNEEFPAIRGEEISMTAVMTGRNLPEINTAMHVTVIASGNASLIVKTLEFLMLPYIFPTAESAEKLFRSDFMIKEINQLIAQNHNVRAIGWLIGGYRHMTNSKKPVKCIEDMKGLIIRTPRNRLMRDTYMAFGARVKPLNWADTFNALKEGGIDGQENPYNVIYYSKFWEAKQLYVTNNGPFLWVGPILINDNFYQSLPIDLRGILDKAAFEASEYEWNWIAKKNDLYKKKLLDNGMQIFELEDKTKWIEVTRPLWEDYYSSIGYEDYNKGKELVDKVLSVIAK